VTIPSVPSAPMNNFVKSNPAEDLCARERVLITSPEGRTTVCRFYETLIIGGERWTNQVEEPLSFRGAIPDGIGYIATAVRLGHKRRK
jgi:hypothetical protein